MMLRGLHNMGAVLANITCLGLVLSLITNWRGLLVIFVVALLAWQQEERWIAAHLKAEVESAVLPQAEYDMIGSYRQRLAAQ